MNALSRRELLTAFLGLPTALDACRRSPSAVPDGTLISPTERIGHLLRDGFSVQVHTWERVPVVIVGGGVAGLSAAWRLALAGVDFVLLELEEVAGGTAKSGTAKNGVARGFPFPWGAHYVTVPMPENRLMTRVLRELGAIEDVAGEPVVVEEALCRDPEERLFYRGRWYEGLYLRVGATRADLAQYDAFRAEVERLALLRDPSGRRAFAIPMARCSTDADFMALDRISMADWMDRQGYHSERLRWLVSYACRDDYGARPEETSAWAGLFYFASRVRSAGVEPQAVVTWPEGNGKLVDHLYQPIRDRVRLGVAVASVNVSEDGIRVAGIRDSERVGLWADQVILATPQFLSRRWLRRPPLGSFDYGAWMVANLSLSARPKEKGFPLAWDNVFYDSPSLGYVVATHQSGLDYGPTVFTYYYPLCDPSSADARRRLLGTDWRGWSEIALADLSRAHPGIGAMTERLDVVRWGHAMIRPSPGFLWGAERRLAAEPVRVGQSTVHGAHSDLGGVALFEEALDQGVRAAEEVLAARSVPYESWR
ncbi:MAG: FAD-dependent oxidoreductase [Myxococcales bacterium]